MRYAKKLNRILRSRSGASLVLVLVLMLFLLALAGAALTAASSIPALSRGYMAQERLALVADCARRTLDEAVFDTSSNSLVEELVKGVADGEYSEGTAYTLTITLSGNRDDGGLGDVELRFSDIERLELQQYQAGPPVVFRKEALSFRVHARITVTQGSDTLTKTAVYECTGAGLEYTNPLQPEKYELTAGVWRIVSYR